MGRFHLIDGRLFRRERAMLRADDLAVQHGWGVFETIRLYDGVPFALDAHLERMRRTLPRLRMRHPLDSSRLRRWIAKLVAAEGTSARHAGLRLVLTRGPEGGQPVLLMHTRPLPAIRPPVSLRRAPWPRCASHILSGLKTLNYLDHALAREYARQHGCYDVYYTTEEEEVLEGSFTNLFLCRQGRVETPASRGILPGVTRSLAIDFLRRRGVPVRERTIRIGELRRADWLFVTSSLGGIVPVARVDGVRLRQGKRWNGLVEALQKDLQAAMRAEAAANDST